MSVVIVTDLNTIVLTIGILTAVDNKWVQCYNTCIEDKELDMKYTLIARNGKVFTFFIKSVAETFQQAYGGNIITAEILKETQNVD